MTDVKIATRSSKPRRKGGKRRRVSRGIATNEMMYRGGFEIGPISSGTTGQISDAYGFSISSVSEYSSLQTLFTECKLVSMVFRFVCLTPNGAQNFPEVLLGVNRGMNSTTNSSPTSYSSVQNLTKSRVFASFRTTAYSYRIPVPRGLEHTIITGDAPATILPYAGSPGCLLLWADHASNSTNYFTAFVVGVWHLRGRQ